MTFIASLTLGSGAGPLPHPAAQSVHAMGDRVGARAGTATRR